MPLLFAYGINSFSHDVAHFIGSIYVVWEGFGPDEFETVIAIAMGIKFPIDL